MAKVYLVTMGDYSDYHILAAFATKERAELYILDHIKTGYETIYKPIIEDFELDKGPLTIKTKDGWKDIVKMY